MQTTTVIETRPAPVAPRVPGQFNRPELDTELIGFRCTRCGAEGPFRRYRGVLEYEIAAREARQHTCPPPPAPVPFRKVARLRQLADGTIQALGSDGVHVYRVSIGERNSCECPAGQHGRTCYHWRTAAERFPAFWVAPKRWAARAQQPVRALPRASIDDLYGPEAA